jgi:hypothetical protein
MIMRRAESLARDPGGKLKSAYNLINESYMHGFTGGGGLSLGEMQDIYLC